MIRVFVFRLIFCFERAFFGVNDYKQFLNDCFEYFYKSDFYAFLLSPKKITESIRKMW